MSPTAINALATLVGGLITYVAMKLGVTLDAEQTKDLSIGLISLAVPAGAFAASFFKNRLNRKYNPLNVADPKAADPKIAAIHGDLP